MKINVPTFTLLTKALDVRHLVVLHDWLVFLNILPSELVIYIQDGPSRADICRAIDELAQEFQVSWRAVNSIQKDDLRNNETDVLLRMVQQTYAKYLLFINLDTLPYHNPVQEGLWLQEVFTKLEQNNEFVFFSGCGLIFRGDRLDESRKYLLTQRFSNNFGLIQKDFWLYAIQKNTVDQIHDPLGCRFHSEWALEEEFRQKKLFGLRRVESYDWRVFHVQQWDDRLLKTRELFRRGVGINRYLNRVHEECLTRWDYYYNYPKPPLSHRIRVFLGKYRRLIWNSLRECFALILTEREG